MEIPSGSTDRKIYFVALDATDFVSRETGLSSFTVVRSRDGAADVTYTTPTIAEIDATTMPGVYALTLDEDTTLAAGHDTEEYCLHITHAGMAPVTRVLTIYRVKFTEGQSAVMGSSKVDAQVKGMDAGTVTASAIATGAIDADAIASAAITESKFAAGAINAGVIADDAIDAAAIAAGAITSSKFAAGAITSSVIATDAITDAQISRGALGEIADAVWDEPKAGHTTADTFGDYLDDEITSRAAPGDAMDLVADAVDAAALKADALAEIADAVWDELIAGHTDGTKLGAYMNQTLNDIQTLKADTDDIQTRLPAALEGGFIKAQVKGIDAGLVNSTVAPNLDAAISSRLALADYALRAGTAQSGTPAADEIQLDAGASAVDSYYRWCWIAVVAGTGAGQLRQIEQYAGATKIATVVQDWDTVPDNTSRFVILGSNKGQTDSVSLTQADVIDIGFGVINADSINSNARSLFRSVKNNLAATAGGTTSSVILSGSGGVADVYNGMYLYAVSGSNGGVARPITDYSVSFGTGTFTVSPAFPNAPAENDLYEILPIPSDEITGAPSAGEIAAAVDAVLAGDFTAIQVDLDAIIAAVDALPSAGEIVTAIDASSTNLDSIIASLAALSIPTADENADALLDRANAVDTKTPRQIFRLMGAFGGGKSSGTATNDVLRAIDDSKNRITTTIDGNGHRTAVTLDLD